MKIWLPRLLPVLGLILIVLSVTSILRPAPATDVAGLNLAFRQIGHEYLLASCDSTSRIPAVEELADGTLLLRTRRYIDYKLLAEVAQAEMVRSGYTGEYQLTLTDSESNDIFLGGVWIVGRASDAVACLDRDQEQRAADIRLKLLPKAAKPTATKPWLLAGGSLLMLLGIAASFRPRKEEEPLVDNPVEEALPSYGLSIGKNAVFLPVAQQITVNGEEQTLTFREAKLLEYLVDNANVVLERQTIHDAVWGEEGVMVGRSLDVFISRLRKKLVGANDLEIQTVHGVGYRFRVG